MGQRARAETVARHRPRWEKGGDCATAADWTEATPRCATPGTQSADPANVVRGRLRSETAGEGPNWNLTTRRFTSRALAGVDEN